MEHLKGHVDEKIHETEKKKYLWQSIEYPQEASQGCVCNKNETLRPGFNAMGMPPV